MKRAPKLTKRERKADEFMAAGDIMSAFRIAKRLPRQAPVPEQRQLVEIKSQVWRVPMPFRATESGVDAEGRPWWRIHPDDVWMFEDDGGSTGSQWYLPPDAKVTVCDPEDFMEAALASMNMPTDDE